MGRLNVGSQPLCYIEVIGESKRGKDRVNKERKIDRENETGTRKKERDRMINTWKVLVRGACNC